MYCYSYLKKTKLIKALAANDKGISLIETLIALTIMGMVAVVFLTGLETSYTATMIHQERVTAEDLSKSQLEYVKGQAYDAAHNPPQYLTITGTPAGYYVQLSTARLDPKGDGTGTDDGLQEITVNVYKGADASGKLLLTVKGYKLNI